MNDDKYYIEAKKIRSNYEALLLKDLLFLNYKYNSFLNKNTNIEKIYNEMQNPVNYSKSEKKKIINESILKLREEFDLLVDKDGNVIKK